MQIPDEQMVFMQVAFQKLLDQQELVIIGMEMSEESGKQARITIVLEPYPVSKDEMCACSCHSMLDQALAQGVEVNVGERCWTCGHAQADGAFQTARPVAKSPVWRRGRPDWLTHEIQVAEDNAVDKEQS